MSQHPRGRTATGGARGGSGRASPSSHFYPYKSRESNINPFIADLVKAFYTLLYWSKPPFFIFDIRALWHSGLNPLNSSNLEQLALTGLRKANTLNNKFQVSKATKQIENYRYLFGEKWISVGEVMEEIKITFMDVLELWVFRTPVIAFPKGQWIKLSQNLLFPVYTRKIKADITRNKFTYKLIWNSFIVGQNVLRKILTFYSFAMSSFSIRNTEATTVAQWQWSDAQLQTLTVSSQSHHISGEIDWWRLQMLPISRPSEKRRTNIIQSPVGQLGDIN